MKAGDWVKVDLMSWQVYGFLLEVGELTYKMMTVYKVYRNGEVDYKNNMKEYTYHKISPAETSITSEDLLAMVDLALMTRDRN